MNAREFEDYMPKCEKVVFESGEMNKVVPIELVHVNEIDGVKVGGDQEEGSDEEANEVMFKVKIDKPDPKGVKVSKKNCCIITIVCGGQEEKEMLIE